MRKAFPERKMLIYRQSIVQCGFMANEQGREFFNCAFVGQQTRNRAQQRCFAAAILAAQNHNRTLGKQQVDRRKKRYAAAVAHKVFGFEKLERHGVNAARLTTLGQA
jgi:hypothetical protein